MTHVDAYLLDGSTFVSGAKLQSPNVKGNVIISLLAMLLIICAYSNCNMCIPYGILYLTETLQKRSYIYFMK